jgi:hypothetical protein
MMSQQLSKRKILSIKESVESKYVLNTDDCERWIVDPMTFWPPSFASLANNVNYRRSFRFLLKETMQLNNNSTVNVTALKRGYGCRKRKVSLPHLVTLQLRFLNLSWHDHFTNAHNRCYAKKLRSWKLSKSDEGFLKKQIQAGTRCNKLSGKFGVGILLTIPTNISRAT